MWGNDFSILYTTTVHTLQKPVQLHLYIALVLLFNQMFFGKNIN